MHALILAAVLPVALAGWNTDVCNGAGGCTYIGGSDSFQDPWRCPDGSSETISLFANDLAKAGDAGATAVSKEEFPKTCYGGRYPDSTNKLVKIQTVNNQTVYAWQITICDTPKVASPGNCYSANPNPTTYNFCAMFDKSGGQCKTNPNAGYCERWGYSTVNPQCKDWKPGQPDLPNN